MHIIIHVYTFSLENPFLFLSNQKRSFIRVKGKVELSKYRLVSHDLQVTDRFLLDVMRLPLWYEKGIYFTFIEDYGTHYTKNGVSGGEYELVYVLNQDAIKEQSMSKPLCQIFLDSEFTTEDSLFVKAVLHCVSNLIHLFLPL